MKVPIVSLFLTSVLFAVPAVDTEVNFTQANGSSFKASLQGDEYLHWVQTKDGYISQYNPQTKNYEYMLLNERDELVFSSVQVSSENNISASPLAPSINSIDIKAIPMEKLQLIWKRKWEEAHPKKGEQKVDETKGVKL